MIVFYYCVSCVAIEMNVTEPEAHAWIRAAGRTALWERAKANPPKTFEFAESSKKGKRILMRKEVVDIFRPEAKAIILNQAQMIQRAECGAVHKQLCE